MRRAPALVVDVSASGVRAPLGRERIAELARRVMRAERVRDAMLSIALVSPAEIARLNRRHLDHRGATDVISFGARRASASTPVVGDVYIAPDVARANARQYGVPVREELARLVVHGVLHVLGHDHPDGEARESSDMWRRQERHVKRAMHHVTRVKRDTRGTLG